MRTEIAYPESQKYKKRISHLKYLNSLGQGAYRLKMLRDKQLDCMVAVFYKVKKYGKD